jgi:TRAP-type transport system small permease protein
MRFSRAKGTVLNSVNSVTKGLTWIAYVTLAGMILVTTANVFGRYIFKKPLLGEVDMVELGMAVLGGIAMFLAATQHHHVRVDVLLVRFSRRFQVILAGIASLLGFAVWVLLAYRAFLDGLSNLKNDSRTATLFFPQAPFEIILSIGMFLFCLTLLIQAFRPEKPEEREEGGPRL